MKNTSFLKYVVLLKEVLDTDPILETCQIKARHFAVNDMFVSVFMVVEDRLKLKPISIFNLKPKIKQCQQSFEDCNWQQKWLRKVNLEGLRLNFKENLVKVKSIRRLMHRTFKGDKKKCWLIKKSNLKNGKSCVRENLMNKMNFTSFSFSRIYWYSRYQSNNGGILL